MTKETSDLKIGDLKRVATIDADTHPDVPMHEMIDYIPEPWRSRYYTNRAADVENARLFYASPTPARTDALVTGMRPGEDKQLYAEQVFQESSTDYAMLLPLTRAKWWDAEWETARCTGINEYIAADWLGSANNSHGRYRAGIRISPGDPAGAIAEMNKWVGHGFFPQVQFAPEALVHPVGHPLYRPVLREAARLGLPIAMHITREGSMQSMTPVGYSSYHIEVMGSWSHYYVNHLASLIFDGVFDELPDLRVVFVEGGFSWLTPAMWRFDRYWQELGAEVPNVKRRPSDSIRQQIRITTQPFEEPKNPRDVIKLIEAGGLQDMLMFSSDYPHWDYDDPRFIAGRLPASWRDKVLFENARELYNLPEFRPVDELDITADPMTRYSHGVNTNKVDNSGHVISQVNTLQVMHEFVGSD
jgi:predicted TIM-barrel fold metal-dependent hydrolase